MFSNGLCTHRNIEGTFDSLCYTISAARTVLLSRSLFFCLFPFFFFFFFNHHASYIEHAYGHTDSVSFPFHKCPQIEVPCEQVLRNFSRQVLRQIRAGRRLGTSGQIRPLKASFQDEYYRSSWNVIPGIGVNSEYNAICDGRIDFLIPSPGWGVELLRDGDRIEDHSNRFGANGLYYSSIQTGVMKDWKIIDCRHSYPRKACNAPFTSGLMSFKVNLQGQFPRKDGFGRQCLEMIVPVCIFSTVKTRRLCRSSLSRIFCCKCIPASADCSISQQSLQCPRDCQHSCYLIY